MPEPKGNIRKPEDHMAEIGANLARLQAYLGGPRPLTDRMLPIESRARQDSLTQVARDVRQLISNAEGTAQNPKSRSR
jgi:hypothetical protein